RQKIEPWYLAQKAMDDVIVSASPEFLLRPVCAELGITNLIASRVDRTTGVYDGLNCYGDEKVARFRKAYGEIPIERFYSDSLSDSPLAALANESFLVSGGKMIPWSAYRPSAMKKAKQFFFSKEFARFLLIGGINTFNGVLFAYLFSLLLQPNLAFAAGYLLSLTISYLLNSFFTFRESLGFSKYVKFCVSYIPNFLIQNAFVLVFMNWLGMGKLITYILAAVVGIPVTFAMLKLFAFRRRKKESEPAL
ncbi:MAG: GtrA family protein, partial [Clostridiaceae bacterium]